MANWDDRLLNSKIWAQNGSLEEPTSAQADQGWEFLGDEKPSFGHHNAVFQYQDRARDWLFRQMKALAVSANITPTAANFDMLRAAVLFHVNNEARARAAGDQNEANERARVDQILQQAINTEINARATKDGELFNDYTTRIDVEAKERARVDLIILNDLQAERLLRGSEDARLEGRINSKFIFGSPGGTNGEWVAPAGCYRIKVTLTGGGGGGAGCGDDGQGGFIAGSGGGAGGAAIQYFATFPGQRFLLNIGLGGAAKGYRATGENGATSYFSVANEAQTAWIQLLAATGGVGGGWVTAGDCPGGPPGRGYGGLELTGGYGGDGQSSPYRGIGGHGGASFWGGGGRAGKPDGATGAAYGAGGGGAYGQAGSAGSGQVGVCVIEGVG